MTGKDGGDAEAQTSLTAASAESHQPRRPSSEHAPRRVSAGKHSGHGAGLSREEGAQILEITEKHGTLYNAIPCMPLPLAIICCVFNIVVPGLGEHRSGWN
ncbi:hypothetical protein ACOMHN_059963 [Nucella lapillus]